MDPQIDEQVAKLLGGLKKVEAPQNFEGRVMARLSEPVAGSGGFGFLKLALPTGALAALALFLFLSGYLAGDVPHVDVVSATDDAANVPEIAAPQDAAIAESKVDQPREYRAADSAEKPQSFQQVQTNRRDPKRSPGGGSYDIGSGDGGGINARGIDTNSRPGPDPDMERMMRRPTIMASDVLQYAGMTVEFRGGWTVTSVVQHSVADRAGLKTGDVVIALNDVRIGRTTSFPSGVDIKVVRVNRSGSILDLRPQPLVLRGTK